MWRAAWHGCRQTSPRQGFRALTWSDSKNCCHSGLLLLRPFLSQTSGKCLSSSTAIALAAGSHFLTRCLSDQVLFGADKRSGSVVPDVHLRRQGAVLLQVSADQASVLGACIAMLSLQDPSSLRTCCYSAHLCSVHKLPASYLLAHSTAKQA